MNKQEIIEFRGALDIPDHITDEEVIKAAEGSYALAIIRLSLAGRQLRDALAEQAEPILKKANIFAKKMGF